MGGTLKVGNTNVGNIIIRNINFAPGYGTRNIGTDGMPDSYVYDAMNISGQNVMIDHVSAVFATDETISADERANNVTVQYSTIAQGQNYPQWDADVTPNRYTGHSLGSLLQMGSNAQLSVHHNLYAHLKGRMPRVGTESSKLTVPGVGAFNDFRNNVFYNWLSTAGTGASGQASQNNFVNNFYLTGAGGEDSSGTTFGSPVISNVAGGTGIFNGSDSINTKVYHGGNLKDTNYTTGDRDANDGVATANSDFGSSSIQLAPLWYLGTSTYTGVTDTASGAYNRVLDYVGANWWNRNPIDARIIDETRTLTGTIHAWDDPTHGTEWNALLALRSVTNGGIGGTGAYIRSADWDTEVGMPYGKGDGMPSWWELAHGLDPNGYDHNGDFDNDGYTNLEEYLNEIAQWPAPQPINWIGGNGRYALISNWDIRWQPSRFDTVVITTGTATVDAVGQHANIVRIGGGAGPAELALTAGWLDVAQEIEVKSSGTVNWSGGLLGESNLKLISGGRMNLAPGGDKTLRAGTLSIDASSTLDLNDNDLVVNDPTSFAAIQALVLTGYGNTSGGIISSTGNGAENTIHALFDNALVGATDWNGVPIDPDAVVGKYTYFGDVNLDGQVTGDDYTIIDSNLDTDPAVGIEWLSGEANMDGLVTGDDYTIIDSNLGSGVGLPLAVSRMPGAAVPEPGAVALSLILLPLFTARRRNRVL
jgi:hypothetical protein